MKQKIPFHLRSALKYENWDSIINQLTTEFVNAIDKDFEKELERIEKKN